MLFLFAYMVEGGGSKTWSKAKKWLYCHNTASMQLLQAITDLAVHRVFSSPSQLPFRVASPVIELNYYPINFPYYFVRTLENDYLFGYKGGKREGIAK